MAIETANACRPVDFATLDQLLSRWSTRVKRNQLAHRFAAKGRDRAHILIGLPTVALSAIVGTSIFTSIGGQQNTTAHVIFGLLSLLAAILAALQTFLGLEELSNKHRLADSGYSAIRQRLEEVAFSQPTTRSELISVLADVRSDMERLAREAPVVPERYWQHARRALPSGRGLKEKEYRT